MDSQVIDPALLEWWENGDEEVLKKNEVAKKEEVAKEEEVAKKEEVAQEEDVAKKEEVAKKDSDDEKDPSPKEKRQRTESTELKRMDPLIPFKIQGVMYHMCTLNAFRNIRQEIVCDTCNRENCVNNITCMWLPGLRPALRRINPDLRDH
jgi:hypothetical protein